MSDPSDKMALTIVDTTGIQAYIFGTNTLRHHMGASWLVDWATQGAVYETLREVRDFTANLNDNNEIINEQTIEDPQSLINAELLYAGGGNAVLIFRTKALAITFAQHLTQKVLTTAPGLQLIMTHIDLVWTNASNEQSDVLAKKLGKLRKAANRKKHARRHSMPLLGLGVTADCQFIDLPAEAEIRDGDGRSQRVSGQVQAKWEHSTRAAQRLVQEVRDGLPGDRALPEDVEFIYDFDEIGSPGESSFLAVVHIDGNGMGQRFQAIADTHQDPSQNRAYINEIRRLSNRVRAIAKDALCGAVLALQRSREQGENGTETICGKIPLRRINGQLRLPFRPIVYGGDDVTFVCDGRLGLTLAAHYLQAMEQQLGEKDEENSDSKLYVRAGIAVVNNHYPFSRAYELAEELADSAKGYLREISPEKRVSAMDWHFAVNGLTLPLETLRQRDYTTVDGSLLIRPLLLEAYDGLVRWRTWSFFAKVIENFQENLDWVNSRNKVIAYGEALRNGPNAARQFLKAFVSPTAHRYVPGEALEHRSKITDDDIQISNLSATEQQKVATAKACGWYRDRTGHYAVHYDAVEAFDFFVLLRTDEVAGESGSDSAAMQKETA